jgi:hypothetical protein
MIPKKPAPDLIRGVQRFSENIMLKQETMALHRAKGACAAAALPAAGLAGKF